MIGGKWMNRVNKVLIVDDQEGIRKLLSEACSYLGYEVELASCGEEALKMVIENKYKVVLIDMKMPAMNGLDALKKLREHDPDLRAIMMTGYGETFVLDVALKIGIHGVILKPFDLDELRVLLAKLLK